MDNLPRLLAGEVPRHEQRAGVLRAALGVTTGLIVVLLVLAAFADGAVESVLQGVAWSLLSGWGLFVLANATAGWHLLEARPDLGPRAARWAQAGASPLQLRILNEAHRVDALNPPVGYGDRRTLINPLADSYAIFTSPAWRDPWLVDRKLWIDPIVESAEIIAYVHQVTSMLREVGAKMSASTPGSAAYRAYAGYQRALLASLDDGLTRARALTDYRTQVAQLEVLLQNQRALLEAEAFADRVRDVLSESARQTLAAAQLEDGREQLALVEAGLREITEMFTSSSWSGTSPEPVEGPQRG